MLCLAASYLSVLLVIREWPFSREYVRGDVSGQITLFVGTLIGGAMVVGLIQVVAYRSTSGLLQFLGALLVANLLLSRLTRRYALRRGAD